MGRLLPRGFPGQPAAYPHGACGANTSILVTGVCRGTLGAGIGPMTLFRFSMSSSILAALGAAVLFGGSTPLAKQLVGDVPAMLLAGLLYLGSGIGLSIMRCIRDRGWRNPGVPRHEWPWLVGAIVFGG